jgi:hypothetical protein
MVISNMAAAASAANEMFAAEAAPTGHNRKLCVLSGLCEKKEVISNKPSGHLAVYPGSAHQQDGWQKYLL